MNEEVVVETLVVGVVEGLIGHKDRCKEMEEGIVTEETTEVEMIEVQIEEIEEKIPN